MPYAYIGVGTRIYSAYLEVRPDGQTMTLRGVPGGDPVHDIRPAAGNGVPPTPRDGLWVPVTPSPNTTAKTADPAPDPGESSTPTAAPAPPPEPKPARTRKAPQR